MTKNIWKHDTHKMNKDWGFNCYNYANMDTFLKEVYGIAESTYRKYMKLQEKQTLKIDLERVNNSINGNPRYQITGWDNEELFDKLLSTGKIRNLKKGYFTPSDAGWAYGIENSGGQMLDGVRVIGVRSYR